jgi:hypothetical protein
LGPDFWRKTLSLVGVVIYLFLTDEFAVAGGLGELGQ